MQNSSDCTSLDIENQSNYLLSKNCLYEYLWSINKPVLERNKEKFISEADLFDFEAKVILDMSQNELAASHSMKALLRIDDALESLKIAIEHLKAIGHAATPKMIKYALENIIIRRNIIADCLLHLLNNYFCIGLQPRSVNCKTVIENERLGTFSKKADSLYIYIREKNKIRNTIIHEADYNEESFFLYNACVMVDNLLNIEHFEDNRLEIYNKLVNENCAFYIELSGRLNDFYNELANIPIKQFNQCIQD